MARRQKGIWGIKSDAEQVRRPDRPVWRAPAGEDINPGDVLHYYSATDRFSFRVVNLTHHNEWIVGRDTRDPSGGLSGTVAVRRVDCMTEEQAGALLQDRPAMNIDAPLHEEQV